MNSPKLCYKTLADAYVRISGDAPPDLEERSTNLLNHLVWGSYWPGDDPTNDEIIQTAFGPFFDPIAQLDGGA